MKRTIFSAKLCKKSLPFSWQYSHNWGRADRRKGTLSASDGSNQTSVVCESKDAGCSTRYVWRLADGHWRDDGCTTRRDKVNGCFLFYVIVFLVVFKVKSRRWGDFSKGKRRETCGQSLLTTVSTFMKMLFWIGESHTLLSTIWGWLESLQHEDS
jgi:hypothetical protein